MSSQPMHRIDRQPTAQSPQSFVSSPPFNWSRYPSPNPDLSSTSPPGAAPLPRSPPLAANLGAFPPYPVSPSGPHAGRMGCFKQLLILRQKKARNAKPWRAGCHEPVPVSRRRRRRNPITVPACQPAPASRSDRLHYTMGQIKRQDFGPTPNKLNRTHIFPPRLRDLASRTSPFQFCPVGCVTTTKRKVARAANLCTSDTGSGSAESPTTLLCCLSPDSFSPRRRAPS